MNPAQPPLQPSPAAQRDRDIVELLRCGNHAAAFALVAERYESRIYRLCVALLRDSAAAEDVAQESLIRVWKSLPGYDGRAAPSTWIYAITRNRCLTALERTRATLSLGDEAVQTEAVAVAAMLGRPEGTVKTHLFRARGPRPVDYVMETSMTPRNSPDPERDPTDAWPQGDALDRLLSAGLRPPALPAGFHAALDRAIDREKELDGLSRRRALEADHAQRLAELRAGYVRVRSRTLGVVLAVAFTAGAGVAVALPLLASAFGTDIKTLAPLLAAMASVGFGVAVSLGRVGVPRQG